ncbi:MAG: N-acetylmuramoyl-L-alanine amidase [Myxococcales bacterium]|nr:N-acetylmuramoyl-L-alanine amidase [Myxococcales bacterium]MCB9546407.1 N-acetylmuramoyl-L-alanine amidase [Myxococcales bacterium]
MLQLASALIVLALAPASGLRLVVLDPGHGGENEGAPAKFAPGTFEKHLTLDLAQRVAARLRAVGVQVTLTREDDRTLPIRDRINLANRLRADVFVSVHLNSTERPGPKGHETFFLSLKASDDAAMRLAQYENQEGGTLARTGKATGDPVVDAILLDLTRGRAQADAQQLAAAIQRHVAPRSAFPDLGVKQAPFHVLMGASMPAVVWEGGFLNHFQEGKALIEPATRQALAEGIADGVLEFGATVVQARRRGSVPAFAPYVLETPR